MIRIPKRFYDDHAERDLRSPAIVKETARHYWIAADQNLTELLSDAEFYRDVPPDLPGYFGLVSSARATANAIRRYLDDHREQAIKDLTGRFERVDSDLNGNPRYVLHFLAFGRTYDNAYRRANAIGWRKYTAKSHGGCFVGQSYSLPDTARSIVEGNPHYSPITAAADQEAAA